MAQIISDTEMAGILTDMADSQVPALSPIKSPKRPRDYGSPVTEIPDAEPAPKTHNGRRGKQIYLSLRLAVQTKTTHQVRPRIPDRP